MDERLVDLEIKFSFAQDLLEELNQVVFRQQKEIEGLQQALKQLRQQMRAALPGQEETWSPAEELPPHY